MHNTLYNQNPKKGTILTGHAKENGNRIGLVKSTSSPKFKSEKVNVFWPSTGVVTLP